MLTLWLFGIVITKMEMNGVYLGIFTEVMAQQLVLIYAHITVNHAQIQQIVKYVILILNSNQMDYVDVLMDFIWIIYLPHFARVNSFHQISFLKFLGCPSECIICNNLISCQSCQNGFYLYGDTCVVCQQTCKTCYGPMNNDCNSCSSGYYSLPASPNICQETCPIGYYPDTVSSTCFGIILSSRFLIILLFRMPCLLF